MAQLSACTRLRGAFICTQYLLLVAPMSTRGGQATTNYQARRSNSGPEARLCCMCFDTVNFTKFKFSESIVLKVQISTGAALFVVFR